MNNAVTHALIAVLLLVCTCPNIAAELPTEPPPDDALVRQVEERVELLRKWRVIEAIDPSPELADKLFPLLSHQARIERELNHERDRLTEELRRGIRDERAPTEYLNEILASLTRIRDERCALQKQHDDELARLLTVDQRARLTVVLDDFHREVQQLIQRARYPRGGIPRDQFREPGP